MLSKDWIVIFSFSAVVLLLYLLSPILVPFFIAALLAYFLNPLVNRLTSWHVPRLLSVILVFATALFAILLAVLFLIPLIEHQIQILIQHIPKINAWFLHDVLPWLNQHFHLKETIDLNMIEQRLLNELHVSGGLFGRFMKVASASGMALIGFFSSIFLVPVVCFYLLIDWGVVTQAAKKLLPRNKEQSVVELLNDCGNMLSAFFRGQLMVMFCLGIIYSFGLWLVGLDVGILIGLVAGLLSVVPYLGFLTGMILAVIAGAIQFGDWTHIIWILLVFGIGEMAESWVLIPSLVGDRVGIHPVAVIFSVMAGAKLFGFAGVLIAVPVTAVIMVFIRRFYKNYLKSHYYLKN